MHLKPALKWLVILTLAMIVLSAFMLASISASVQQTRDSKTQDLFSLFQNANITVSQVFRQLEADGETVPQASLNEYNEALVLAEESESLLQAGNYSEAESKIIQALQKFKEALRIVYTTIPDQPTETEIALEKTAQLKSSINRYSEQLQRIENLTGFAAAVGYNTTAIEAEAQTIKSLLDKALSNVNQNRFEAASNNLAEAKTFIDSLVSALNNIAANLKIQRLQTYIAQTEARLAAIRETAILRSNTASLEAVNDAETSLNNAKEHLEKQQINETLSELANSRASEEEAVEYLKPAASLSDAASNKNSNTVQSP